MPVRPDRQPRQGTRGRSAPRGVRDGSRPAKPESSGDPIGADTQSARDRAALASALDPIITINSRGIIQSASDSVLRVLGWTPSEIVGRSVNILMPEPHRSAHDGYLADYQRTGRTGILNRPRRFDAIRKDGVLVPIELCVSRAEIPGGDTPLFVGIIRDMSAYAAAERSRDEERARAQQQLAEQTSALQRANLRLRMADRMASIGTLAAGLGHDMNNVLLPVRARLNALKASGEAGNLPGADLKHVDEVRKSVAYLQQLADGLHFLAMNPDAEEDLRGGGASTDLRRWWSQTGMLLSKAVPRHARVSAAFPADLPPVGVAAHALTQAVLNLVVNAGESIPPPSERKRRQGHVRIWAQPGDEGRDRWVRLSVMDNGAGMSDEVKRRAFEMFFTTKPRGLGTGLGLALVRKVVDRAGGRVEIESELGEGTTVTMIMPAVGEGDAPAGGAALRAVVSVADGRAAGLVRHLLESSGVTVDDGDHRSAHVWVIDPSPAMLDAARAWRRDRPDGRLVLFGGPEPASAKSWGRLNPVTIEAPDDFEALRRAFHHILSPG